MKLDLKAVLILIAVLVVATIGSAFVTSWVFSNRTAPVTPLHLSNGGPGSGEERPYNPDLLWNAGEFTANLVQTGNYGPFVKTAITLEVSDKKVRDELDRRKVQIRDRIIAILLTTTSASLREDPDAVKQRIMDEINSLVGEQGRVYDVFFSDLIIQ